MPFNLHFVKTVLMGTMLIAALPLSAAGYQVTTITDALEQPWSIAELPNNNGFLITEKAGRLLHVDDNGNTTTISGTPDVFFKSQGGLLDVVLDPEFASNQRLYLSYAGGNADTNRTTVVRAKLSAELLSDSEIILEVQPNKKKAAHFGGKLAFLPDGTLLLSVGEGFEYREQAQSLNSELGKLLRINRDGSAPADNPFPKIAPRVYSYGHRNPQGLVVDPAEGTIWMAEHGPKGGDELNRIVPGTNYGWPAITYGVDYSGAIISPYTEAEGMAQPVMYWVPSIATSGLAIYRGTAFPDWSGSLFTGALVDQKLYRLAPEGNGFVQSEPFPEVTGRVRDVRVLSDGSIAVLTDEGTFFHITAPPLDQTAAVE
ncbi:MAG: PQQ-dependent sugar dehydrogenase [Luminiphilus sp.]|nr:PQQ-dependent sugar dehydrogenase [Luminiphilus sp.]